MAKLTKEVQEIQDFYKRNDEVLSLFGISFKKNVPHYNGDDGDPAYYVSKSLKTESLKDEFQLNKEEAKPKFEIWYEKWDKVYLISLALSYEACSFFNKNQIENVDDLEKFLEKENQNKKLWEQEEICLEKPFYQYSGDNLKNCKDEYVYLSYYINPSNEENGISEFFDLILNEKDELHEKSQLILARRGQGKYRADLLKLWKNKCCVTGTSELSLVRASHILPWNEKNKDNLGAKDHRINPNNGLPLVASLDAAFDKFLISFDPDNEFKIVYYNKGVEDYFEKYLKQSIKEPPIGINMEWHQEGSETDKEELKKFLKWHIQKCEEKATE